MLLLLLKSVQVVEVRLRKEGTNLITWSLKLKVGRSPDKKKGGREPDFQGKNILDIFTENKRINM